MFDGTVANLTALAAINITDPKGDGTLDLTEWPNFSIKVISPGNNSPAAWFHLKNEPAITTGIHNWATIAGGRTGNEVWISSGDIVAPDKTAPDFTPPANYAGIQWISRFSGVSMPDLTWVEKWHFDGNKWIYKPTVIVSQNSVSLESVGNPQGQGTLLYSYHDVYIANGDLSGWTLLTTTSGGT